jgi:hypothetical protein
MLPVYTDTDYIFTTDVLSENLVGSNLEQGRNSLSFNDIIELYKNNKLFKIVESRFFKSMA